MNQDLGDTTDFTAPVLAIEETASTSVLPFDRDITLSFSESDTADAVSTFPADSDSEADPTPWAEAEPDPDDAALPSDDCNDWTPLHGRAQDARLNGGSQDAEWATLPLAESTPDDDWRTALRLDLEERDSDPDSILGNWVSPNASDSESDSPRRPHRPTLSDSDDEFS
jgi:hypothetical protein